MIKQRLHENWTARAVGHLAQVPLQLRDVTILARVPGCIHTDLLRAGLIPDPYRDFNEHKLQWIGETDWQYTLVFEANDELFTHERIDLVCDGVDTVATIELNGQQIAKTQNMFRGYRFDVRGALKRGSNELSITFASPVRYAEKMRDALGARPYVGGRSGPFPFIRKMACNFGWDWSPALTTCGIWRGIRLEGWSGGRISSCTIAVTSAMADCAELQIDTRIEGRQDLQVALDIFGPSAPKPMYLDPGMQRVKIEQPTLWWPRGHGNQTLYELLVGLYDNGRPFSEDLSYRIGLRTIELDTSSDDIGRKLHFNVDGLDELMKNLEPIEPEKVIVPPSGQTVLQPARLLPSRANFDDVHYLLQLNHARAMQVAVEWFRSRQPVCMGTLYWQFNDHWPAATSCSAVDGDGRLKPLWYATRKFYASELLTIQPEADGVLRLNRINDREVTGSRHVRVVRRRFDGTILAEQAIELPGGRISRVAVDATVTTPEDPSQEAIVAGDGPGRAMWFFDVDKKLRYPAARYETELLNTLTGYDFTIRAGSFLRDIVLNVDRLDPDAVASEQIVTLFPGETFAFSIKTDHAFARDELSRPPVFQCANRFGK